MAEVGSGRNWARPRGTAAAPGTLPDAAASGGSRTSRNSTSGLPTSFLASSGLMRGTAAFASSSIDWTVFMESSRRKRSVRQQERYGAGRDHLRGRAAQSQEVRQVAMSLGAHYQTIGALILGRGRHGQTAA